jgi:hypothetical protein
MVKMRDKGSYSRQADGYISGIGKSLHLNCLWLLTGPGRLNRLPYPGLKQQITDKKRARLYAT